MFFDPDCEHCQRAIKNIDSQYRSFEKVAVYLISQDSEEKMKGFSKPIYKTPQLKKCGITDGYQKSVHCKLSPPLSRHVFVFS